MRILVVAMVTAFLAGCAGSAPEATPAESGAPPVVATGHALQDAAPPGALTAPVFELLGTIAAGGPVYGAGEPSTWVAPDGMLYAAFPGCDRSFYLAGPLLPGEEGCAHGLVFRSQDGQTWERMNRDGDGRYTEEGPTANGDADVAVDAAGNMYASNLGNGIQFHTFWAGNQTWEYMANVVPEGESADRQWMAAGREGHVIMTWMRTAPERDVEVNVTFDGGRTWHHGGNYGDGIGWLGTVQISPDGAWAYIPYTQPTEPGTAPSASGPQECAMHVLVSADGGLTWDDIDTGARWTTSQTGGHWSCVHMAPALDVTGNGTVVVAWSQDSFIPEDVSPFNAASASSHLYLMASRDHGQTWSEPEIYYNPGLVLGFGQRIMPWVTGGAGDRAAITYLYNPVPTDQDYTGAVWDVRVAIIDGLGTHRQGSVDVLIEEGVHAGGICTRGGACLLTGSDRAFLDFFEADITPEGQLFVTYPHDLNPQKMIEVRAAMSDVVLK